jgi:hypothetical protein
VTVYLIKVFFDIFFVTRRTIYEMTDSYFNIKYFERQITCHKNGSLINNDHARNVKRFWDRRPKDLPAGVGENLSRQDSTQDEELVGRVAIGRGRHSHEVNSIFVHRHCYENLKTSNTSLEFLSVNILV